MQIRKFLPFVLFFLPWFVLSLLNYFFFNLSSVDYGAVMFWYYYLFLLGINFLPITQRIFPPSHSGIVFFSKLSSLLLIIYVDWLLGHISFLHSREARLIMVLIVLVTFAHWKAKDLSSLPDLIFKFRRQIVASEIIFLVVFSLFLVLRSYSPEIYWGEKPMDFTLLNFMGRNPTLPAEDPWFSGHIMKYYYWGYYLYSGLIKVSGAKEEIGYALSVATSAAFFAVSVAGFLYQLTRRLSLTILGSFLMVLASHWNTIWRFSEGVDLDIIFFWKSARVFKAGEFAEFPFWSFLFADLHPHVMSYAFFVLSLSILVHFWSHRDQLKYNHLLFWGLCYGSLLAINTWDFVVSSLFLGFISLFYLITSDNKRFQFKKMLVSGSVVLIALILFLPMILAMRGGESAYLGFYYGIRNQFISYLGFQGHWWATLIIASFPLFRKFKIKKLFIMEGYTQLMLAMITSTLLLNIVSENFIIHDRFNSVFKFGNATYILWGLLALLSIRPSWFYFPWKFRLQTHLMAILILAPTLLASYFNAQAMLSYNPFGTERPNLSGSRYLKKMNPGDYDIVEWIRKNVDGTPVLLEGHGHSFDHRAARISMHTGLPIYLGWTGHVRLRGAKGLNIEQRKQDVDFIYNSNDALKAYELLQQKGITFIAVGPYEESQYTVEGLSKFSQYKDLFKLLVKSGSSSLYSIGDVSKYTRGRF